MQSAGRSPQMILRMRILLVLCLKINCLAGTSALSSRLYWNVKVDLDHEFRILKY